MEYTQEDLERELDSKQTMINELLRELESKDKRVKELEKEIQNLKDEKTI